MRLLVGWSVGASLLLAACGAGDEVLLLDRWTLDPGGGVPASLVELPAHLGGALGGRPETYRLRTTVILPRSFEGEPLTLAIAAAPGISCLTVNGARASGLDPPAPDAYPAAGPQRWRIPAALTKGQPENDVRTSSVAAAPAVPRTAGLPPTILALELTVHYTHLEASWFNSVPRLSASEQGDGAFLLGTRFSRLAAVSGLNTILLLGALHLLVFLFGRPRPAAAAWVAVSSFIGVLHPAYLLGITQSVFGIHDRVLAEVSVAAVAYSNLHFIHAGWAERKDIAEHTPFQRTFAPMRRVWSIAFWLGVVAPAVAAAAIDPFDAGQFVTPLSMAFSAANIVYLLVLLAGLLRRSRPAADVIFALLAYPVSRLAAAPGVVEQMGLGELVPNVDLTPVAVSLMALYQAFALSLGYVRLRHAAGELTRALEVRVQTLEEMNREISALNLELRHQIDTRSEEQATVFQRAFPETVGHAPILRSGDEINQRYRVVREIGAGGMGVVYEVERLSDGRRLALKLLSCIREPSDVARFTREARNVSRIDHPNVVAIHDVDIAAAGFLFIVMDLVRGRSLSHFQPRFGDRAFALGVLEQVVRGLEAVHRLGLVHRDLKPGNVLVAIDEASGTLDAKIADFGISTDSASGDPRQVRALGRGMDRDRTLPREPSAFAPTQPEVPAAGQPEEPSTEAVTEPVLAHRLPPPPPPPSERLERSTIPTESMRPAHRPEGLTRTGMLLVTLKYMAPEVVDDPRRAAAAADMFSFGLIAHLLLTSQLPFAVPLAVLRQEGRPLPAADPLPAPVRDPDPQLAALIERCVSADPEVRPTAAEMVAAFEAGRLRVTAGLHLS